MMGAEQWLPKKIPQRVDLELRRQRRVNAWRHQLVATKASQVRSTRVVPQFLPPLVQVCPRLALEAWPRNRTLRDLL